MRQCCARPPAGDIRSAPHVAERSTTVIKSLPKSRHNKTLDQSGNPQLR
ncbi:hypothetical protein I552_4991 [Mycobacterium xenopi 3993]|nr:hypothetical protein I552_4991 [Mycobacterium xenopi 3993]